MFRMGYTESSPAVEVVDQFLFFLLILSCILPLTNPKEDSSYFLLNSCLPEEFVRFHRRVFHKLHIREYEKILGMRRYLSKRSMKEKGEFFLRIPFIFR